MQRTSLRCASHATHSTRNGCRAKSAAASAEGQKAPVMPPSVIRSSALEAACSATLTQWCRPGFGPKSSKSSISESQVSGCQLAASKVVKAHATPERVRPARTMGLSAT